MAKGEDETKKQFSVVISKEDWRFYCRLSSATQTVVYSLVRDKLIEVFNLIKLGKEI